ncbi:MAG: hypothetical protein IPK83_18275 [Planctomycetes bacterium]|nr:hypothetical protein [Planctomycetota bacterium]
MTQDARPNLARFLPGRFVVKSQNETTTGLAAHEVLELIETGNAENANLFRIHRVNPDNSLELVGVSIDALRRSDALIFVEPDVAAARLDYDALCAAAAHRPPPCRIDLSLAHVKEENSAHAVVLVFPFACSESVGQWLVAVDLKTAARVETSPTRLADFQSSNSQNILSTTLEP